MQNSLSGASQFCLIFNCQFFESSQESRWLNFCKFGSHLVLGQFFENLLTSKKHPWSHSDNFHVELTNLYIHSMIFLPAILANKMMNIPQVIILLWKHFLEFYVQLIFKILYLPWTFCPWILNQNVFPE